MDGGGGRSDGRPDSGGRRTHNKEVVLIGLVKIDIITVYFIGGFCYLNF
jgi:hypothetical protein